MSNKYLETLADINAVAKLRLLSRTFESRRERAAEQKRIAFEKQYEEDVVSKSLSILSDFTILADLAANAGRFEALVYTAYKRNIDENNSVADYFDRCDRDARSRADKHLLDNGFHLHNRASKHQTDIVETYASWAEASDLAAE